MPGVPSRKQIVRELRKYTPRTMDRTIAYIPRAQFEAWHISVDDLHEAALENLVKRSESLDMVEFMAPSEYYYAELSPAMGRILASMARK